jgi:hypothetical protein
MVADVMKMSPACKYSMLSHIFTRRGENEMYAASRSLLSDCPDY